MKAEEKLKIFAEKHNLNFAKQEFLNCLYGGTVCTYSIYNSSGCFTIHQLIQRNEIDFFMSKEFYNDRKKLTEKEVNIFEYHKEIWKKESKFLFFTNPFFYESFEKIVSTLVDIMEIMIDEKNEIFGIKVN